MPTPTPPPPPCLTPRPYAPGWELAIPKMSKGQRARLTISADLAYGERGYPPVIPSNATLVFEVDLISFG